MPHIHTGKNEHDFTVTAHIIRLGDGEPKALVHMHKKLNKLLPVGGHIEITETPWQAIAHEIAEEAGYVFSDLEVLQPKVRIELSKDVTQHPYPISMNTHRITEDHFHTDTQYAFVTHKLPTLSPAKGESRDLRWLTKSELNALTSDEAYRTTKTIYNFAFDELLDNWTPVKVTEFQ